MTKIITIALSLKFDLSVRVTNPSPKVYPRRPKVSLSISLQCQVTFTEIGSVVW